MTDHYMPPGEPRCSASKCPSASKCVRHIAPYEDGRPIQDFTATAGWMFYTCLHFKPTGAWKKPDQPAPIKPAHECPEGWL